MALTYPTPFTNLEIRSQLGAEHSGIQIHFVDKKGFRRQMKFTIMPSCMHHNGGMEDLIQQQSEFITSKWKQATS